MKVLKNIRNFYRNTINGLYNVMKWLPIIWNDRQWDSHYMWKVLRKKLELMEKFYSDESNYMSKDNKRLERIKTTRILLDRIIADDYTENAMVNVEHEFGESIMTTNWNENEKFGTINFKRQFETDNDREKVRMLERRAFDHSSYMQKQDLAIVCSYLNKYSRTWWD